MATASNTAPPPHHSPRASAAVVEQPAAAVSSPKVRRSSTPRGVSSPWTQIVRGNELESPPSSTSNITPASASVTSPLSSSSVAVSEQLVNASSDCSATKTNSAAGVGAGSSSVSHEESVEEAQLDSSENGGSNYAGKKTVWNRPSNGASDVSPVMGAVSWPALSESTKSSPKSSSSDSLKNLSDGSISVSQGIGIGSSSSPRQVSNNHANLNSTPNHVLPTRQRSMKRGGGGGGGGNSTNSISANGGFLQAPPPKGTVEVAPNSSGKTGHSSGDSSLRENTHKESGQRGGFGSQLHGGTEHHQQRNSFRRGNGGPHSRGDGYGGRRDHDRTNQDWNSHRNFGGRDGHIQPQRGPRPFMQGPPHANTSYVPPPITVRPPFGAPMVYSEMPSPLYYVPGPHPDSFRAVPMVAPMAPLYIPFADPHLPMKIVNQIEYYFSNENLVKDTFLRRNMDEQGWVSVKLIANFKKVQQLTEDIQLILAVLQSSSVVEVEGENVRRRDDWAKWIMPRTVQYSPVSSPQSLQKSSHDMLAEHLKGVTLDDKNTGNIQSEGYPSRLSSGEFGSQSHQSGDEMIGAVTIPSGQPTLATSN